VGVADEKTALRRADRRGLLARRFAPWPRKRAAAVDPATLDLAKLIECRTYDVPSYNALAFWLVGDEAAQAQAHFGLTEEKTANFMLKAYALKAPITVFGRQTRHIVFNSSGPMAVLDEADPHPLAKAARDPAGDRPARPSSWASARSRPPPTRARPAASPTRPASPSTSPPSPRIRARPWPAAATPSR
jgi:hypothetical protein